MGICHFLLLMDFAIQKLYIAAAGRMHCKIILKHFLTRLRRLVFRLATFATCVEQSNFARLIRLRRRFPVARFTLFAQYRVIIKQTTHACHNQTGQSFSGISFTSEHAGCEFPCLLHRKNPLVSGQLPRSINYRHKRRDKVL